MTKQTEKCGRCSASTVVDVSQLDMSETERRERDPFATGSIEVDEAELRRVSPGVWLARASDRLDAVVQRFVYR